MANLGSYRFEVEGCLTSAEAFRKIRRSSIVRSHNIRPFFNRPVLIFLCKKQSSPTRALVQSRFASRDSTRKENLLLETMFNSANGHLLEQVNIFCLKLHSGYIRIFQHLTL